MERPQTGRPVRAWTLLAITLLMAMVASSCGLPETITIGTTPTTAPGGEPTTTTLFGPTTSIPGSTTSMPGSTTQPPGSTTLPAPVRDPLVAQTISSFNPWRAEEYVAQDGRNLSTDTFEQPNRVVVTCAPATQPRSSGPVVFDDFATFPFSGDVLPGLIVEGRGVEQGDLRVIPLERAELPLVVNLASETPSVVVADPSPSSLRQGVSDLMRAADQRLTGLPVVPANIRFVVNKASSFEEAVLGMGVSLRYASEDLDASFKSTFEQRTGIERHSVTMRLLQPMFTISADRSRVANPGDYFGTSVTGASVDAVVAQGRMGTDNPPVLIDAITYGRAVYMTVTSSSVTNADDLRVAVTGAYGGFSGEASVEEKNRKIVNESEIRVEAFGGNQDVALQALKSGSIQDYMESVDTSTAAPLSMVLRTLDGTQLAVTDQATITDIGCTRRTKPNEVGLQLDVAKSTTVVVTINGTKVGTYKGSTSPFIDLSSRLRAEGNNRVEIQYKPPTCVGGSMTASFKVNGSTYQGKQWRIAGHAFEWACTETGTWNVDLGKGTVALASGPPALRET